MDVIKKACSCKGIRTCLLCENEKCAVSAQTEKEFQNYMFCPHCNLCWPEEEAKTSLAPFYLEKIVVVPEFISKAKEQYLVSSIDQIPWMPSQSGRRKQDFGPRANFKKKKVKIGDFKGFPSFGKNIIDKLLAREELKDFVPVELCHLEYTPERGSAIEPHIDDLWLWGDRLVTINLLSHTILTLTPTTTLESRLPSGNVICCDKLSSLSLCNSDTEKNYICGHRLPFTSQQVEIVQAADLKKDLKESKIAVKISLPPRSLFILSGSARCNWFHEVKRKDISSRRLAMTFRELAEQFERNQLVNDILEISKTFCDFSKETIL